MSEPVKNILLVGANSFLACAVMAAAPADLAITSCPHDGWAATDFSRFDAVTNFAWHPGYRAGDYDEAFDQDLAVARRAAQAGRRFVMLSTRKVYGPAAPFPASEDAALSPSDAYGRNKARTESALRSLMGDSVTVLRLANVFGFEPGRTTFFGIALESLRGSGRIVLDCAAGVRRDFLPAGNFAAAFCRVLAAPLPGTFNLGSGAATALGDIAAALFQGYGGGELVVTSSGEHDNFLLDSRRLTQTIGPYCAKDDVLRRCVEIGKELHENRA